MYDKLAIRNYDLFFFDCETGGLDPREADMVEVAAIRTDPTGKNIIEEFERRVFPKKPVHPKAAAVNGYTPEKWAASAIELEEVMPKLINMSHNAMMVAHNAPFDWGFLETAIKAHGMRWRSDYHKYCTVALAMPLLRQGLVDSLKLEVLAPFFNVEHKNAHSALGDVHACRGVYLKLMEIYEPAMSKFAEACR